MYLETFLDNDPSQEPDVDWQQPHPQNLPVSVIFPSLEMKDGSGRLEKPSKMLSDTG